MRLFAAFELSEELMFALAETSALLRAQVRGRYVAPDSFHVTAAFLGDVPESGVGAIGDALVEACGAQGVFSAELGELGSFGRRAKATLWQGFRDAGAMPALAGALRDALDVRGVPYDDKPFMPHVTLMRAADVRGGGLPMPLTMRGEVESLTLFRSDLSGAHTRYEPLYFVEFA